MDKSGKVSVIIWFTRTRWQHVRSTTDPTSTSFIQTEHTELIKTLVDMVNESCPADSHSLRDYRGLGAHLYDGTDARKYVHVLRSDWIAAKNQSPKYSPLMLDQPLRK